MTSPPHVLITGACGLVGTAVLAELLRRGHTVTATDLDTPGNRAALRAAAPRHDEPGTLHIDYADLTDGAVVERLIRTVAPDVVIHLAAVIPPHCYAHPGLARAVNVDATAYLLAAAESLARPPRFIQTSSVAVYGPRNPHSTADLLAPDTPVDPIDLYGGHKAQCEQLVRDSTLDWIILRLGGVLGADMVLRTDPDITAFEAILPADGRIQTVAVDDVAVAFANATTVPATRFVGLIGGDTSHRVTQSQLSARVSSAMGLIARVLPTGRLGDPDDDAAWFATDWMDTTESQRLLAYQQTSFDELLAAIRLRVGLLRLPLCILSPAAGIALRLRSPYRRAPGRHAAPWDAIAHRWGNPAADEPAPRPR